MSFVVVTKVEYKPSLESNAREAGLETLNICKSQTGLSFISFNQSTELNETLMYWEWVSESAYEEFMQSEEWTTHANSLNTTLPFEDIKFSSRSYERIA